MSIKQIKGKLKTTYEVAPVSLITGKRLRRRFDRKVDAQNFVLDVRTGRAEGYEQSRKMTFSELASDWLESIRIHCSESHYRRSKAVVESYLDKFGHMKPENMLPKMLLEVQAKLLKIDELSPNSVNRQTEVLKAVLQFGVNHRLISENPFLGVKELKIPKKYKKFWNKEEALSFLLISP